MRNTPTEYNYDERRRLDELLGSLRSHDEDALRLLDDAVLVEARSSPELVALVGEAGLSSERALTRSAATIFLGRAAEIGDEPLARKIGDVLVRYLHHERDEKVVEKMAIGLFHALGRREDYEIELQLARDPDHRARIAAAFALAHSDVSESPDLQTTLRDLARDDNDVVRFWADVGLRHIDS